MKMRVEIRLHHLQRQKSVGSNQPNALIIFISTLLCWLFCKQETDMLSRTENNSTEDTRKSSSLDGSSGGKRAACCLCR